MDHAGPLASTSTADTLASPRHPLQYRVKPKARMDPVDRRREMPLPLVVQRARCTTVEAIPFPAGPAGDLSRQVAQGVGQHAGIANTRSRVSLASD